MVISLIVIITLALIYLLMISSWTTLATSSSPLMIANFMACALRLPIPSLDPGANNSRYDKKRNPT